MPRGESRRVQGGRIIGLWVLLSIGAAACQRPVGEELRPIDWGNPINGVRLASPAEAVTAVSFTPVVPTGSWSLVGVFVSMVDPTDRSLAYVYDDPVIGRFAVEESRTVRTPADLVTFAEQTGSSGSDTESASIVSIRRGTTALVVVGPNTTYCEYIDGGVDILVIGPSSSFTAASAMAIANG